MKKNILIDSFIDEENHHEATYEIYRVVHQQYKLGNISLKRVNRLVGDMLAASSRCWRVVGITKQALERYKSEDFLNRTKGIQRAHKINRIDTIKLLIESTRPLGKSELFDKWNKKDKTVLGLSSENRNIANIEYIPINNPYGDYFTNQYIGFRFHKNHEGVLLRNLWEKHNQ